LGKNAHTLAGAEYGELLKAHGIHAHVEPKDRGDSDGAHLGFLESDALQFADEAVEHIHNKATTDKKQQARIIHEKLGWAFEHGYRDGFQDGAKARKMRYRRPTKKTPKQ
jgi:diadenosine tetraphosphate (Ap4A) HIT family hydrolase